MMCLYADVVLHLRVNCCIPMVRGANQRGGEGGRGKFSLGPRLELPQIAINSQTCLGAQSHILPRTPQIIWKALMVLVYSTHQCCL
jgi:hypothetical protein